MDTQTGKVVAVSTSTRRGIPKTNVDKVLLVAGRGIQGDAHAGASQRQISLLALESIAKMVAKGLDVGPGAFAENITTEGVALAALAPGDRLEIGPCALVVTQIGKECHAPCEIGRATGECVMPREGIFARVVAGGAIAPGDAIAVLPRQPEVRHGCDDHVQGERG